MNVAILSWPRLTSALCAGLTVVLGLSVLLGWAFHSAFLIQVAPGSAPMDRNTAVSVLLLGVALLGSVERRRRVVLACSGAVAAVACLSLAEYAFRVNVGIDQLWVLRTS